MEQREFLKVGVKKETEFKVNKRELVADSLSALGFCVLAILLGSKKIAN